jgi:hypothetical protein
MLQRIAPAIKNAAIVVLITGAAMLFRLSLALDMLK